MADADALLLLWRAGTLPDGLAWLLLLPLLLAGLTFVPTPYIYATRGGPFATLINAGAAIWFVLLGLALVGPAGHSRTLAVVSLIYPLTYLALSAGIAIRRSRR